LPVAIVLGLIQQALQALTLTNEQKVQADVLLKQNKIEKTAEELIDAAKALVEDAEGKNAALVLEEAKKTAFIASVDAIRANKILFSVPAVVPNGTPGGKPNPKPTYFSGRNCAITAVVVAVVVEMYCAMKKMTKMNRAAKLNDEEKVGFATALQETVKDQVDSVKSFFGDLFTAVDNNEE
jgi:hypothetical protein